MSPHALIGSFLLIFALAGCTQTPTTGVPRGDGPANGEPSAQATESESATEGTDDNTATDTDETTDGDTKTATFKDKYVYEDKVEVEVIKIQHGKLSRKDLKYAEDLKAGDPWTGLTVRVRNKSSNAIDADGTFSVTYGPDGDESQSMYNDGLPRDQDLTGKILPGRSKLASQSFDIPAKYQSDVVLEFSMDMDHESAVFAGSVK